MKIKYLFVLILLLLAPILLTAVTQTGVGSNLLASWEPLDPKPGDTVSISLSGFGFDLNKSYIEWTKNGQKVMAGEGKKTLTFQLGALGQATKIDVAVYYGQRHVADKSFYFQPTELILDWQADTLVPPFYLGKARATPGSRIKILATPYLTDKTGRTQKNQDLDYRWQKNGELIENASGVGKNTLLVDTKPTDQQLKISLTVSTKDGLNRASQELLLHLSRPEIAFYEQKPLEGVNYRQPIAGTYDLVGAETSFKVIPLFWPLTYLKDNSYDWQVNNLPASDQASPDTLTVRQPEGGAGLNQISLKIKNNLVSELKGSGQFNIKFGNNLLKFNNGNQ